MRNPVIAGMIAVGTAFVVVLGAGFWIHPLIEGVVSDNVFGGTAAFLLVGVSFGLMWLLYDGPLFGERLPSYDRPSGRPREPDTPERVAAIQKIKEQAAAQQHAYQEFKRERIAALASDPDPVRRSYAARIGRGESWTNSQIAYEENKSMTATCAHLVPVEREMRRLGIAARLRTTPWPELKALPAIDAKCHLNEGELRDRFQLFPSVLYQEGYQPERHEHDNPWASLSCRECQSRIDVLHPDTGGSGVPWFPSEPRQVAVNTTP